MNKKTLAQIIKAVGGVIHVDKKNFTVYLIPENKEEWFYDFRKKIGFNNLFHGEYDGKLSFVVFWDSPSEEFELQTLKTKTLLALLENKESIIKVLIERGVDSEGKFIGFKEAKEYWRKK